MGLTEKQGQVSAVALSAFWCVSGMGVVHVLTRSASALDSEWVANMLDMQGS